ncbi:unnamed protein product [Paramecium octaurelia]|uniref:Proteasome subunit beta n=1 Tax=Paramecium octaurelia TaxID=43137 RepID=A0A8S1SAI6_PAROT|nr:unnamed protein product [Paramecium octaurelia]CAD8143019.1 unnamed protein product [Paramecium octaurelia]
MYIPVNDMLKHFKQDAPAMANITHKSDQWSPYHDNSGTVLAVGIPGAVIVAGDTRLSNGYNILSRDATKLSQLTDKCVLATAGQYADFIALRKFLQQRLQLYEFQNEVQASTETVAHLLSRELYSRRFFPYYTFNLLAGLDENNHGVVYGYDAIGSYDKMTYGVQGSGQELVVAVLDNQLKGYNKINKTIPQTREEILDIILDCFSCAAERDIHTGDNVEILIITAAGTERIVKPLRKD